MIIALIPARAGSVRLPGKNMRMFAGKPLVQWTIEAALQVCEHARGWTRAEARGHGSFVAVSSDGPSTLAFAEALGAYALRRPHVLSQGDWPMAACTHLCCSMSVEAHDWIMLLQPTSPLRTADDIRTVLAARERHGFGASFMTCDANSDDNGAVFLKRVDRLIADQSWKTGDPMVRVQIPVDHGVDIDTLEDFERAEKLMLARLAKEAGNG